MVTNSFYPVILSDNVSESSKFYKDYFCFKAVFESDWYVSMILENEKQTYEFAILDRTHSTLPDSFRNSVQGLILNFEVDDVDSEYERLIVKENLPLHLPLKNEDFGQRHFITSDPNGILIDMIKVIPPSEEFIHQYTENTWSTNGD
ncbi:VOC family protein [Evansella halocellulosilytica]|uniref:VOC family protein n=1 Tax=Evansella halocellulosilytica TaxID=2011013 RepID=UPI000BB72963|nr:VOC family protein [Evansella halocellulosilytica]